MSTVGSNLKIQYLPPGMLMPNPNNARTHNRHQRRQIAASIQTFGFTNPVWVDSRNVIIAGHGRVEAAKLLGIDQVPTIRLEGLTEDQIRAYVIADNRLAEKAGWDKEILAIELQHLNALDLNFDITTTGFEIPEIDQIFEEVRTKTAEDDKDEVLETDRDGPAVTQFGDLWQLGRHKVFCGNSLHGSSYQTLMGSKRAHAVFTDPPYNVAIDGNVCGKGEIRHREFAMGWKTGNYKPLKRWQTD
ncbi:MAG TPA: ParB N-terminal domain-containing protein [Candidatus Angelobacter sp.]|jgi:hypothetical protein